MSKLMNIDPFHNFVALREWAIAQVKQKLDQVTCASVASDCVIQVHFVSRNESIIGYMIKVRYVPEAFGSSEMDALYPGGCPVDVIAEIASQLSEFCTCELTTRIGDVTYRIGDSDYWFAVSFCDGIFHIWLRALECDNE